VRCHFHPTAGSLPLALSNALMLLLAIFAFSLLSIIIFVLGVFSFSCLFALSFSLFSPIFVGFFCLLFLFSVLLSSPVSQLSFAVTVVLVTVSQYFS
jgi:hypothetical protein